MKKICFMFLLLLVTGGAVAAPKGPAYLKSSVMKALMMTYQEEMRHIPQLRAYLEDESQKPFQTLFQKVQQYNASLARQGKRKEGLDDPGSIQSIFLKDAKAKETFAQESGMNPFMVSETLQTPVIHSFSPEEGGVGTAVIIKGDHFRKIKEVGFFWGVGAKGKKYMSAVTPNIISSKEIQIAVPKSGVNQGTIYVLNEAGQVYAKKSFKITAAPTIAEIYPYEAMPGQTIHVIGSNFENVQSVTVDGKSFSGKVTIASLNSIDIALTQDAPQGFITVTTKQGSARSPRSFKIKNIGPEITDVQPRKIYATDTVTIRGDKLQHAMEVKFSDKKAEIVSSNTYEIKVKAPEVIGLHRVFVSTLYGSTQWGNQQVEIVAKPTPPPPPPQPKVETITINALGNPELCFGAVGKGCGGFGDLKDDETKASRPGWLAAGCSEDVDGKRRCWVVPGSIKHDNCCVGHPHGKHCGGPMSDGSSAGEWNHDRNCVQEWDDAVWDVKNGRGWEVDFVAKKPGDLTPASSPGDRYSGGERVGTASLCAPNTASISARHSVAFCCSRNAKKYWAFGVEDWYICEKSGRSIQQIGGKQEGTPTQFDMSKAPSKPGEPKQQPVAEIPKPAEEVTEQVTVRETTKGKEITKTITRKKADGSVTTETKVTFEPKPEYEGVDAALKEAFIKKIEIETKYYLAFEEWLLDPTQTHYKKGLELYKNGALKKEVIEKNLAFGNANGIFDKLWGSEKSRKEKLSGKCYSEPIVDAYQKVLGRLPNGLNNTGECLPEYYLDIPMSLPPMDKLVLNVKKRHGINTKIAITHFEPKEGGVETKVTLKGENFDVAGSEVVLGCYLESAKQKHPSCVSVRLEKKSDKEAVVTVPMLKGSGPIVLYSEGDGYVGTKENFNFYPPPVVREMRPKNPRADGTVELIGENLFQFREVTISGIKHYTPEKYSVSESKSLSLHIPAKAQDGEIVLTTKGGTARIPLKLARIIPIISRVEPAKAKPGDVVSLHGQNLGHLKKITIGEKIVSTVGKGDNNSVLVTVPDSPAGKYEVTAANNEGTGKWGNHFQILNVPRPKPAPPKAPPVVKKQEPPKIKPQPALLLPPLPPPSETVEKEVPQEPEIAVRNEPPEEIEPEHCENGTWSPTLRTCIEDQAPEEAAPPECPGGTHWSPTLKSCQPD